MPMTHVWGIRGSKVFASVFYLYLPGWELFWLNGAYELDILTGIMVTTRRNDFTQHEVVGEDGVPVTVGASGSGVADVVEEGLG